MSKTKIFLAHASEDKELVRELHSQLKSRGLEPWLDEVDLIPGQNWQIEIQRAIRESDIFLACLSKRSIQKRGYVQKEYRLALNTYAEKPFGSIYLIPVKLDNCDIPDFQIPELGIRLRDIQWVDLWKEGGAERLLKAINHNPTIEAPLVSIVNTSLDLPTDRNIKIVDISFIDEVPKDIAVWLMNTGNYAKLDIKLRNTSDQIAFLKYIFIHVDQIWGLEPFDYIGAAIPPSAEYNIELPIKETPYSIRHPISQSIPPNDVDRFLITLRPETADHLFLIRLEFIYDEDDKSIVSDEFVFATRDDSCTYPTASEQVILNTEQAINEHPEKEYYLPRWEVARESIRRNNKIRDSLKQIEAKKNEVAISFEKGEPLWDGI